MKISTLLGTALAISLGALACVIPEPRMGVAVAVDVPPPTVGVSLDVQPNMAFVDGVYVVENSAYPVFYTDGFYWRYYGNRWYRSHSHHSGWAHVGRGYLPGRVRGIRSPHTYTRYRARPGARRWQGPARGHRGVRSVHRPGARRPGARRPGVHTRPGVHRQPHVRTRPGVHSRPGPHGRVHPAARRPPARRPAPPPAKKKKHN